MQVSPLTIIYSAPFSIQVPQNRLGGRQCCSIFLPIPTTTPPILSATSCFIFPNDQSQQQRQQQCRPKASSHPISFLGHPEWRTEMRGEEGLITRDKNCRPLLLAVTTVDGEQVLISWFAEEVDDNLAKRITDHNRCLTLTTATMVMALVPSPTVTFQYYSNF